MTDPGRHRHRFAGLPTDIASLARIARGLVIHEHFAAYYGVTVSEDARQALHVRRIEDLLDRIVALDDRDLQERRPPQSRVVGNCRHFTVLLVAMLRSLSVPARARCGFGGYFLVDGYEDHWVCEYWDAEQRRWRLVDAQIDGRQRNIFGIDFDLTDVPRDQFLVGGMAWALCRAGEADPDRFGLSVVNEFGWWWIASNLMRDAAALDNIEVLPWDSWGGMPKPDEEIDDSRIDLFDRLACLTTGPDACWDELVELCDADDRLRIDGFVHNDLRNRDEPL